MRQKRTDIQALRALAVISVVLYHLWPHRITGGFMGVDIFFVISGFLMTLTLMKGVPAVLTSKHRLRATGTFLLTFYARRIKRLIPAAAVALIGITALVYSTGNLHLISKTTDQVQAAALFAQNWKLAAESTDYLAPSEPPTAVQHFWSLSLEEQFYLVWPIFLVIASLATFHIFILYKNEKVHGIILPITLLAVCFFIYGYTSTEQAPTEAYFITPARVWELIIGGIIVFLPTLKNYDLKLLLPWFGLAINLYALFMLDGTNFPGWHALLPVLGTTLILYGGTAKDESNASFNTMFRWRPIQWIGDVSYSLYLWHWPLIVLLPVLLTIDIDGPHGLIIKLGILLASFAAAWLSYTFVEQSTQKIQLSQRWIYICFIVTVGFIAGGAGYISSKAEAKAASGLRELYSIAAGESECFGARAITHKDVCGTAYGAANSEWRQYIKSGQSMWIIQDNERPCGFFRPNTDTPTDSICLFGDESASTTIALFGDSHIDQWVNAFHDIGIRNHIRFVLFSSGPCSADLITKPECSERLEFIKHNQYFVSASTVMVAFLPRDDVGRSATALETIATLSEDKKPIYLIEDPPYPGLKGGLDCRIATACTRPKSDALGTILNVNSDLVSRSVISEKNIIKTDDLFCDATTCYSFVGGVSVYRDVAPGDNAHMSSVYSLSASRIIEDRLRTAGIISN